MSLESFRQATKAWLEKHCPEEMRVQGVQDDYFFGGRKPVYRSEAQRSWFEAMRDRGWTAPSWPTEYGGAGLDADQARILEEEMEQLNCRPPLVGMGLWMIGPLIQEMGTAAQKAEYLPSIVRGETFWCQGFSEPGSGSDLASLSCRADIDGSELVINGSKIWSSMADRADWIFCLVRTQKGERKQQGITFVLVDLASPGISVKPIRLLNGNADFCETFFENVRVPIANVIGEIDAGWAVAKRLLVYERLAMGNIEKSFSSPKPDPAVLAKEYLPFSGGKISAAELRGRLAEQQMRARAVELTLQRVEAHALAGQHDTPKLMNILKYLTTEAEKVKLALNTEIMGVQGIGLEGDDYSDAETKAASDWLNCYGLTIAGGTSEIQLNVIAKRSLELPE